MLRRGPTDSAVGRLQAEMLAASLRSGPQDVALVLLLAILLGGLLPAGPLSPAMLAATFYIALFIHLIASAYDGRFGRMRTFTWFLLICAWIASEVMAFAALMLPWGQFRFWLASKFAGMPVLGKWLSNLIGGEALGPSVWSYVLFGILALDLLVMHHRRWQAASPAQIVTFIISVIAAAVILSPTIAQITPGPPPGGFAVMPPWYTLPIYELLRLVPGKAVGIGLAFAAMLVLLVLPGVRADRLRESSIGWLWFVLSTALAASWIGLWYLASLPAEEPALSVGRLLAAFHFSYFLVLPILLGRFAQRLTATKATETASS
jgi:ubiquinol-cytochrome c reductase cytochrome b/c1 subunit